MGSGFRRSQIFIAAGVNRDRAPGERNVSAMNGHRAISLRWSEEHLLETIGSRNISSLWDEETR